MEKTELKLFAVEDQIKATLQDMVVSLNGLEKQKELADEDGLQNAVHTLDMEQQSTMRWAKSIGSVVGLEIVKKRGLWRY